MFVVVIYSLLKNVWNLPTYRLNKMGLTSGSSRNIDNQTGLLSSNRSNIEWKKKLKKVDLKYSFVL